MLVPIVGIGASAGGLEAVQRFLGSMRPDSGLGFVLVQHLDPIHESLTPTLLGRYTPMPVMQVQGDTPVEPDHVYVIPPGKYLTIGGGTLGLTAPVEPGGVRLPIDFFLRCLAADVHERAIGIILSGSGTDGTLGLRAIKGAGGLALAQEPASAQHDGMPRSAIASGVVDRVVAPEDMPAVVIDWVQHAYARGALDSTGPTAPGDDSLKDVLAVLRERIAFDFTRYKRSTLARRIHRRMGLRHVAGMADYVRLLREDVVELRALFDDLLIGVTSFFRDGEAWGFLATNVLPALVDRRRRVPVRAWVAGCGTGEEAYTLAMLLLQAHQAANAVRPIQVFASDVDPTALDFARVGLYPRSVIADMTSARAQAFFTDEGHGIRVAKNLREVVVFAKQNLLADPPFPKLDLVTCRNVLMYLEPEAQRTVISFFHYALSEGGLLFLGSAETVDPKDGLFEVVSARFHVYRRIGPTRHDGPSFSAPPAIPGDRVSEPQAGASGGERLTRTIQSLLLERFAPARVVVGRKREILYFSGPTAEYLRPPSGPPTQDLIAWVDDGLSARLRSALRRVTAAGRPVTVTGTPVERGDGSRRVTVVVEPLAGALETEGLVLVTFSEGPAAPVSPSPIVEPEEPLVRQLEHDLKTTREDLQSSVEELEHSNQELTIANEEVMSVNEELRSSNEELETSTEELQSVNEELNTANAQLETKVDELEQANNDLDNLLTSTTIPTIFLDRRLRVRRFTPAATRLFRLIPSDIGRLLGDIAAACNDPRLLSDAEVVLEKLAALTEEVQGDDGRSYVRQILPYRTRGGRVEGVVITFSDAAAEALQEARLYAEAIVDTVREPLIVLDADSNVQAANQSFYRTFGLTKEHAVNRSLYELGNREWDVPRLRELLGEILPRRNVLSDFEVTHDFERIGRRTMLLNARVLARGGGRPDLILLAIEDVSERERAIQALRQSESRSRAGVDTAVDAVITIDQEGTILSFNPAGTRIFGYDVADAVGQNVHRLVLPREGGKVDLEVAGNGGITREGLGRRYDGTMFPLDVVINEFGDAAGRRFVVTVRDVSERKRSEEQLRRHQADLAHVLRVATIERLAASLAHELNQPLTAIANEVEACATYVRSGKRQRERLLELLDRAGAEALRAGEIVNHLREFVQRGEPSLEAVDLRDVVRNATRWVTREARDAKISLHVDLGARPLPLRADRVQIEQVVVNLLQNAVEAILEVDDGRRDVYVQTTRTVDGFAELTVHDTGAGFTPVAAEQLFKPFVSTKPRGLGMGLAISRSIVEAHRGRLSVDPQTADLGATVRLALPLDLGGSDG